MANIKRANTSGITKSGSAISDVPDAPTIGAVADTAAGGTVTVAYTAATTGGAVTTFTATSTPGTITGTGASPITVTGLTDNTAYTFKVKGTNSTATGPESAASSSVTPTILPYGAYESIATATGTGSAGSITFSSIPSTFKHLQIRCMAKDTATGNGQYSLLMQLNGDTGDNYTLHRIVGSGATATANGLTGLPYLIMLGGMTGSAAAIANMMAVSLIDILDYTSTTKYKTMRALSGYDTNGHATNLQDIVLSSSVWLNTSAITSITFIPDTTGFTTSSTFALYGIKGA